MELVKSAFKNEIIIQPIVIGIIENKTFAMKMEVSLHLLILTVSIKFNRDDVRYAKSIKVN